MDPLNFMPNLGLRAFEDDGMMEKAITIQTKIGKHLKSIILP